MNKLIQLLFIMSGREVMQKGRELCQTASTPEEIKIAKAYRRVFVGTIILAVGIVIALLAVMFLNNPFLASGDRRYGTVQEDGSIRYVQNDMKYASAEQLGLSDFELESGDRVIIFFDKDDQITEAYPKDYYDAYTENRVIIIVMTALLGVTALIIYALVICRVTPFGRPWYLYCRKIRQLGEPKLSKKQNFAVYAVSFAVSLVVCAPQLMTLIDEIRHMQEIDEFSQKITAAQQAADKAQEMTDALNSLNSQLAENSGVESAKEAAEKAKEIADQLNSAASNDESSEDDTPNEDGNDESESESAQESDETSEESGEQTSETGGLDDAKSAADKIHDIMNSLQNDI